MNAAYREIATAALWMIGSITSFSIMAVAGREARQVMDTAELLVWRSVIGAAIVIVILALSRDGFAQIRTRHPFLHLLRNTSHFFGQYCWYYAVAIIPLAQLFALEFTSPLWVLLAAPFVFGMRLTWLKLAAVGLSFLGVLLVVEAWSDSFASDFSGGQIWGLLAAIGFAGNMIVTKRLTATDSNLCVIFYMTVMQGPMGLAIAGDLPMIPPNAWIAFWVLALSIGGLSAHYCLTQAFRHGDATVVAPMDFARLPVIAIVGALAYGEPLAWNVLAGGTLIFLGNYLNIRWRG